MTLLRLLVGNDTGCHNDKVYFLYPIERVFIRCQVAKDSAFELPHPFVSAEMFKKTQSKIFKVVPLATAFMMLTGAASLSAWGQNKLPPNVVAIVNGKEIPLTVLDQNLRASIAQGRADSPALRQALKDELINREIFFQEAMNRGFDRSADAQIELAQMRQAYLINRLLNDYLAKHPITEAEIKAEFERQISAVKNEQQYKLSLITVPTEAEAKLLIELVSLQKKDGSFTELAKSYSVDPTKKDGGSLDWLLPGQLKPEVAAAVAEMAVGSFSQTPIPTPPVWSVVKLENKRPFQAPTFEQAKDKVAADLLQQQRLEYLKQLKGIAKINQ